jgi:hypothetical protein
MKEPGAREFKDKDVAVKFAQDRVAEGWVTHWFPVNYESVHEYWIVRWWCF